MNAFSKLAVVVISTLFLSGSYAFADCGDVTKSTDQVDTSSLDVDPPSDHATVYTQKDGTNVPLGESYNLATSEQDVVAQQNREETATAKGEEHIEKCALEDAAE